MKKKIIAIIMAAMMAFSIIGCTSYQESVDMSKEGKSLGGGYFTLIRKWDSNYTYYIVYANNTKVMYLIIDGYQAYGITPLYNADGTLQVYDGE